MTEEEKAAMKKGDEIDEVHTSDLEKEDRFGRKDLNLEFFERHDINLARAFGGFDGGFSIR
jgi:hypothetical protein